MEGEKRIEDFIKQQQSEIQKFEQDLKQRSVKPITHSSTDLINLYKIEKEMAQQRNYSQAKQAKLLILELEEKLKRKTELTR